MLNPFRTALATVRLWKFRARRFWTTDVPDCFKLMDWLFILAGVRLDSQNGVHRFVWFIYRLGGYLQMLISFVGCVSALVTGVDLLVTFWGMIIFVAEVMSLIKVNLVWRHGEAIDEMREFLGTGHSYGSRNPDFDEASRNRFRNRSKGLIVTVGILTVIEQIFCWIPNRQQRRTFYIPPWVGVYFGQGAASSLQVIYVLWFGLFWMSKHNCSTVVSSILMMGMQAEQEILVHHFGRFEEDLKDLREEYHDSESCKQRYWDRLKSLIKQAMDRQILLLSKLRIFKSMVETLYFYIYFYAIFALGSAFFIVISEPMSFILLGIGGTVLILALECYMISYLMERLKDIFHTTSGHVFIICSQLPYSPDHRREYLAMRTTLITVGHCSQNVIRFACPGISDISVVVFTQLINTSYSVLTFLLKMM